MFRMGILGRVVLAVLIVGLLTAGGYGVYRMGWAQGYQTAAISAAAAGQGSDNPQGQVAPYAYGPWGYGGYGPRMWGPGFGFFPFFPLFGIGFFLLFLFLIGGLFRGMGYRRWGGGPGPGYWQHEHEHGERKEEERPQGQEK